MPEILPVVWLPGAREDLAGIIAYTARHNPNAAQHMRHLIEESTTFAAEFPQMYRASQRIPGTREIIAHPNYLVLYRATGTRLEVVSVVHVRRNFPIT